MPRVLSITPARLSAKVNQTYVQMVYEIIRYIFNNLHVCNCCYRGLLMTD